MTDHRLVSGRCVRRALGLLLGLCAFGSSANAQRIVATRDLPRNHVLMAADFEIMLDSVNRARGTPAAAAVPEAGWITRRVVRAGEPLRSPAVEPPPAITVGDTVTVVWTMSDGIRVTRAGVALGSAMSGEPVLVRIGALRRLRTIAVGPSTVEVR